MDPKIKCLKCGSYIHDANHCWNWYERRLCLTDKKWKESCDCDQCKSEELCQYCNWWKDSCFCVNERCLTCNEHLTSYNKNDCCWDHTKSPCQFCKLPVRRYYGCLNSYYKHNVLCEECNLPQTYHEHHKHDGSLCKKCGTLLAGGKCIYKCVNGGNRCVHCYYEGVINNMCWKCNKDQNGFLTKAAIK